MRKKRVKDIALWTMVAIAALAFVFICVTAWNLNADFEKLKIQIGETAAKGP